MAHQAYATVHQPPSHHHHAANVPDIRSQLLRTKVGRKCIAIVIPLAILLGGLAMGMKFLAGPGKLGHSSSGADSLSPYTTLSFPASGLYCDSYTLTKYLGSPPAALESWRTSIYLLKNRPLMSAKHNFSIYRTGENVLTMKSGEFYQWSFLLHEGSTIEVNSCVWDGSEVDFYVIQGKAEFNRWVTTDRYASTTNSSSLEPCNLMQKQHTYSVMVTEDDKYYIVYHSSSDIIDQLSRVWVNMSFTKLEYKSINKSDSDVYCSCSLDDSDMYPEYDGCQCDLPLSFSGFVLVETMPHTENTTINWDDKLYVTWSCDGSYNAYLLMFCLPLMAVFIVALLCSDLPKLRQCCKSGGGDTQETVQPIPPHRVRVFVTLLLILVALSIVLGSLCVSLLALTLCLKVISLISSGIPGLNNNDLKLGLLALVAIFFVFTVFSRKLKEWVHERLRLIAERIRAWRLTQMRDGNTNTNSAPSNTISKSTPQQNTKLLSNLSKLIFVYYAIPLIIVSVIATSGMFTFLEGFYPVLVTYGSEADPDTFTPGDTRIFSSNSFFCSEYSISTYGSPHLSATLHLLSSASVTGSQSISNITSNETINENVRATWHFFLDNNSSASIKACLDDPEQYAYFEAYIYDSYSNKKVFNLLIFNSCSIESWPLPIKEMSAGQAGNYLLVLRTPIPDWVKVHVEIELNRYEYFISDNLNSTTHSMCTVSSHTQDSCAASTPGTYGSITGLILVHSDLLEIDWHETISITKSCKYRWATWTAIWLPVLVLNVVFFTVLFVALYCGIYKEYKKRLTKGKQVPNGENEPLLQDPAININTQGYRTNNDGMVTVANNASNSDSSDTEITPPANTSQGTASNVDPSLRSQSVVVPVDIEHSSGPATNITALNSQSVEVGYVAMCTPTSDSSPVDDAIVNNNVSDNNCEETPIPNSSY